MKLAKWDVHPSKTSSWVADTTLWLPVIDETLPAPSVFTPYITRRYSVAVQLNVCGARMGKASFHLDVPVQVVYVDSFDGEATGHGGVGDMGDVPKYVP